MQREREERERMREMREREREEKNELDFERVINVNDPFCHDSCRSWCN